MISLGLFATLVTDYELHPTAFAFGDVSTGCNGQLVETKESPQAATSFPGRRRVSTDEQKDLAKDALCSAFRSPPQLAMKIDGKLANNVIKGSAVVPGPPWS